MLEYHHFREINNLLANGELDDAKRLLKSLQSRFIAMQEEMDMLRTRLESTENALHLSRNLFRDAGFYWLKTATGKLGPFCPRCQENDDGLIRLEEHGNSFCCPYCQEFFPNTLQSVVPSGRHARILHFAIASQQ